MARTWTLRKKIRLRSVRTPLEGDIVLYVCSTLTEDAVRQSKLQLAFDDRLARQHARTQFDHVPTQCGDPGAASTQSQVKVAPFLTRLALYGALRMDRP